MLKGAMMLIVWLGDIIRPTRDVDLLVLGDLSDEAVLDILVVPQNLWVEDPLSCAGYHA